MKKIESEKIFCISFQRNGTRSTGEVLRRLGYSVAGWTISNRNQWTEKLFDGNYEAIFADKDFLTNDAFEDAPWFCSNVYKYLFHKFSKSRFVLLERDGTSWMRSMRNHSNGKSLGKTDIHSEIYNRQLELWNRLRAGENIAANNGLDLSDQDREYIRIYETHNLGVKLFFHKFAPERLFFARLEDPNKWNKLADFLGCSCDDLSSIHENRSRHLG